MRRPATTILLVMAVGFGTGCTQGNVNDCNGVGEPYPSPISVVIRDPSGAAAAVGAVVAFIEDTNQVRDSTFTDSLTVRGGHYGHHYRLVVTKPYYTPDTIEDAYVPISYGGRCGYVTSAGQPLTLGATLRLIPNAPLVRTLLLLPPLPGNYLIDRGGMDSVQLTPLLDANPSVSHAVTWRLSGDTASLAFDSVTNTASFRCLTVFRMGHRHREGGR